MGAEARHVADICRRLSPVYPSDQTRRAAAEFLALEDPGAVLGRALRYLVWQRTLAVALGHLAEAGGDLDALRVPAARLEHIFPRTRVWTVPGPEPVSARRLLEVLERHKALLAEPVERLARSGVDGFVVVSGRGYQISYPEYRTRMEFDTDLLTADLRSGAEVASALELAGYPIGRLRIARLGAAPHAAFETGRQDGDHMVSVGVLVGGYHGHRGPIVARSRETSWRGVIVKVPAAEDLVAMVAARVVRKRQFAFVNYNDVAVVLAAEPGLDWDLIVRSAWAGGFESVLTLVLEGAEGVIGRPAVPAGVWHDLDRTGSARFILRLARVAADPSIRLYAMESWRGRLVATVRRVGWTTAVSWRQARAGVGPGPWNRARRRLELALYQRQVRRAIAPGSRVSAVDRAARWLRRRCGSLCEVDARIAAAGNCISVLGGRPGDDATGRELRRVAAQLRPAADGHDCDRLRFELVAPTR